MSRRNTNDDSTNYIEDLERRNDDLKSMVRELKAKLVTSKGKKHNVRELRELYDWDERDLSLSETVLSFTKEYLFPRFKFLGKDWTEYDRNSGSFCNMVGRKLVLPRGVQWRDVWGRVVAPTIAKKYTDMRCNINNLVRAEYMGNYHCCSSLFVISIL